MQRPRGTRDLLGNELSRIRFVEQSISRVFKRYGYQEVETPIFESLELFTKKSGSEVVKQIYGFEDKSGRKLALRPELTAPVVRLYNEQLKTMPKPLKLFYFGPCFRYERKQAQRWRQFLQAGVELLGSDWPEADAEIVAITKDAMEELEIDEYELRLGHIGLLRTLLSHGGASANVQDPILRAIDSDDESRIEEELSKGEIGEEVQELLKQLIALQGGAEVLEKADSLLTGVSEAKEELPYLREVLDSLEHLGVDEYSIDLGIARGLEYYTGFVFELYVEGVQLAGGGRYDELTEALGGEPCPAVGVAFGIDRIALALKELGLEPEEFLDCMILPTEDSMLNESMNLAKKLRDEGLTVDVDLMRRKLRKALSYADSRGARHVIIAGPKDLAKGEVTIRDMESGDQTRVPKKEVVKKLLGGGK